MGIPMEAFGAEVVPLARWEIYNLKTEGYSHLFEDELSRGNYQTCISQAQFDRIIHKLRLGKQPGPLPPGVHTEAQADGGRAQRGDTLLDAELVFSKLLQHEERALRYASDREWDIRNGANLKDETFARFRSELLWLRDLFDSYDNDHSGHLGQVEARRLLKHLGLQPYSPHASPLVNRMLEEADVDGNEEVDFGEFLDLLVATRNRMMVRRKRKLAAIWAELGTLDSHGCLPIEHVVGALAAGGLLKTRLDYSLAQKVLDEAVDIRSILVEADSTMALKMGGTNGFGEKGSTLNEINFEPYCVIFQRVYERLAILEGERIMQVAASLGFSVDELTDVQAAFDASDEDCSGDLSKGELYKVLTPLVVRPSDTALLDEIMTKIDTNSDEVVDIREFLQLLRLIAKQGGGGLNMRIRPFTMREDVPIDKQQEFLRFFPISDHYILALDDKSLTEMLCNFLSIKPDQNLKQVSWRPLNNLRQLKVYAIEVASKAKNKKCR